MLIIFEVLIFYEHIKLLIKYLLKTKIQHKSKANLGKIYNYKNYLIDSFPIQK